MESSSSSSTQPAPTASATQSTNELRFAFCGPSAKDGRVVYTVTSIVASFTAKEYAKIYSHCELIFENDISFGITSLGLHFERRSLSRDNYQLYAVRIPKENYDILYKTCEGIWKSKSVSFSIMKSILTYIPFISWVVYHVWPDSHSYCSELMVRCLHKANIFLNVPIRGVTPNDIANHVVLLWMNGAAYIPLGPSIGYRHDKADHLV
jgi:hypothetical protein